MKPPTQKKSGISKKGNPRRTGALVPARSQAGSSRAGKAASDRPKYQSRPRPAAVPKGEGRTWVYGRRAVLELLHSDAEIQGLMVLETGEGGSLSEILELAGSKDLDARTSTRNEFDRLFPHQNHQGVAASYRPSAARNFEDLILGSGKASTLLLLDGVEDPQNLGAIIRTAEILGAAGVAIPERRAAGVTPAVVKASAGAALRLSPTLIGNLAQNIERAKQAGYWIYGLDPNGEKSIWEEEFPERILIVMGGEGKGLARLTRSLCDRLLRIPQAGRIGSLNVSAATAIVLAEVLRQRQKRGDAFDLP